MTAVDYTDALEHNWRIFPLYPIVSGRCSCEKPDCNQPGKHPRASNWQLTQPYAEDQLAYLEDHEGMFFGNQLLDHYGIVVNTSGLFIVDVDSRNGGFESAEKLAHIREQCGFIVQTGGGGEHWYFSSNTEEVLRTNHPDFKGIDFKSTGFVVGCGALHHSGYRYEALIGTPDDITPMPAELVEVLKKPVSSSFSVSSGDTVEIDKIIQMLKFVKHDEHQTYERWRDVGMFLHHGTGGSEEGLELWRQWSCSVGREDTQDMDGYYHKFNKEGANLITIGTLVKWAQEGGYVEPVTFNDDTQWGEVETAPQPVAKVKNYADMLPQGSLVEALYHWINSNCLFPREKIAFGAAIQAVSNVAGLNYHVKKHGTTLNLISFAIADSGTGKEAVYQALLEIMRAAGVAQATHGAIKSEQELIRNAIRNQASLYVIDEYGTDLAKIAHAKKGSSANYLVAVPETIMKIFTKANAYYPVTGDMAEEQKERLERQKSALMKRIDDGATNLDDKLEQINKRLDAINIGIPEPYLTFFGISEPTSFDAAIESNLHLITNGFIGRALIFREDVGVPDIKEEFNGKVPLPMHLEARVRNLYAQGNTAESSDTVTRKIDAPNLIALTADAEKELETIYQFWRQEALTLEAEGQGLHTIPLRAREMVIKLAAVLAIPAAGNEFCIEAQHIIAAQKITADLMRYKITHCKTVLGASSKDSAEKGGALLDAVKSVIASFEDGVTAGVIRNRLRSFEREHVEQALQYLIDNNAIEAREYRDGRNRKQNKYMLA